MTRPDTSRKAAGKTAKPPKPSKPSTGRATGGDEPFDRDAEEAKLMKRYPQQKIVRGSLRDAGEMPEFGQKRTIEIICQGDNKTKRRIATSDLHQVRYSEEYIKQLRLDRRSDLRAAQREKGAGKGTEKGTVKGTGKGKGTEKVKGKGTEKVGDKTGGKAARGQAAPGRAPKKASGPTSSKKPRSKKTDGTVNQTPATPSQSDAEHQGQPETIVITQVPTVEATT